MQFSGPAGRPIRAGRRGPVGTPQRLTVLFALVTTLTVSVVGPSAPVAGPGPAPAALAAVVLAAVIGILALILGALLLLAALRATTRHAVLPPAILVGAPASGSARTDLGHTAHARSAGTLVAVASVVLAAVALVVTLNAEVVGSGELIAAGGKTPLEISLAVLVGALGTTAVLVLLFLGRGSRAGRALGRVTRKPQAIWNRRRRRAAARFLRFTEPALRVGRRAAARVTRFIDRVSRRWRGIGRGRRAAVIFLTTMAMSVLVVSFVLGAAFVVNDQRDRTDVNVGDGVCDADTAAGVQCTLRAAIQEANARAGADSIRVVPGVYQIGIAPINENGANVGDFEILDPVTIEKHSDYLGDVVIDGGNPLPSSPLIARGLDRLFEIHPGAGDVTLRNVILQNGYSTEEGGAIQNWSLGKLTLDGVTVRDSYAEKSGGGLSHADLRDYPWTTQPPNLELLPYGRVEIRRSTFTGNGASESGAAINNVSGGTISISDGTVVTLNPGAIRPDPLDPEEFVLVDPSDYPIATSAISNEGRTNISGTIRISNSTVSLNASRTPGAGIANWADGVVTVEAGSKLIQNRSASDGGGLFTGGGKVTVTASEVSKNQAANGGGLYSGGHVSMYGLRPTFSVTNVQLSENRAVSGGGLLNDGEAQLSVTDSIFTKNVSTDHGGAISGGGRSNMTLSRVTVVENESNGEGGGIWTHSERQQTIVDSTISHNRAGVPVIEDGILSDDVAGGGGLHTDGGPVTIVRTTFDTNDATEEGGGLSIHNLGDVVLRDSVIKNNSAFDGGGIENSATRVYFERMTVQGNRAGNAGGGIHNTSSGPFSIIDSTIRNNVGVIGGGLANAPDNDLIIRGSLFLNNSARIARNDEGVIDEDAGKGGGLMSFADGDSLIENTTFSGNKAAGAGGGLFHDADGELRLMHITVWGNSAPAAGGIGVVESDFVPPIPPAANSAVVVRNSIVGGSLQGGNCDWYVRSEGGNLESGPRNTCFLAVTADTAESPIELGVRDRLGDPQLWAIADNGGPTLTHALQYGSFAIDSSDAPCSIVDQRGETRPQNGKCDAGAYEFVGPPPAGDTTPPETYFTPGEDGPRQNSFETMAFTFRGEDQPDPNDPNGGLTPANELNFECRFFEIDLAEQQDPVAPWDPIPPEFMWNGCSSPWSTVLFEEGMMNFEVRAIDRAGNIDPTPVKYILNGDNMLPPDTIIVDKPSLQTNNRSALFSFMGISDFTPPQWFEYECRLDSNDPEMWLECFNPAMYSNLSTGLHTFEVRAATEVGGFEGDPTPARYTWRVGPDPNAPAGGSTPLTCDEANVTLTASADGWVDQVTPLEGYMFHTELTVRSSATDPGNGQPIVPENARAFFRFPITSDAPGCELVSATLRLYSGGHTEGRTLEAVPLEDTWKESTLTWVSQPDPYPGVAAALIEAGELYREWDVKEHVEAILAGTLPAHGWVIRDRNESDAVDGGDQSFTSREMPQDPPDITLPELELRFVAADTPAPPPPDGTLVDRNDVACGEVITESTRLTADVTGCMGEGIAIGAPNIVLDLNGHTVVGGLVLEPGEEDGLMPGIRNNHSNVVIRNGVVTNFGLGVLLGPGSMHSVVEGMTLYRNAGAGVQLFDADNGRIGVTVRGNRLDSNGLGVELLGGTEGATVEDNVFVQNATSILLNAASRNLIRNNSISGLILDPLLDADAGILVENGSRDNVLENNDVSDTGDAGVVIHHGSHGNVVRGGVLIRNGDAGVIVELSNRIEIDGIVSHQQSDGGVVINDSSDSVVKNSDLRYNPSGIQASNTNGLIVDGNDASESLQAGIELGNGLGMRITNNVANLSGGSGISLEGGAFDANGVAHGGALIADNTTNENAEAGISVAEGARHTIARNAAYNNAGYGIQAGAELVAGEPADPNANIDGLGNRASGNHAQLGIAPGLPGLVQCLGVVCDSGDALPVTALDLTAPDTTILKGPLGPPPPPATGSTGSETAVFEFTADDGPAGTAATAMVYECRIDAPPDPVQPVDPDLEPPDPNDPELPEPPEGLNWGECVNPHTLLGLEPGEHVFEVRAHDWAGNFDLTPAVYVWNIHAGVDAQGQNESPSVAPETRITAAPGALITDEAGTRYDTTNRAASLRFVGSDNLTAGYNLVYECRLHYDQFNDSLTSSDMPSEIDLPFQPCVSATQYTNLEYGGHIFEVRAVDLAGNADITPAWHSWWIHPPPPDISPPDTEITAGPDPTTVLTSATFEFTGSDNQTPLEELAFECRLDGAMDGTEPLWTLCSSPHTLTVGSSATAIEHVLQVRAVDLAGNVDDVNGTTSDSLVDGVPAAYLWTVGAAPVNKTVFCGQKITQSIVVNNNLGDCLGHGLIVGASGITIDLNGKTIDGKSIGAGILNNGFDSVTIRNGKLIDFDYGVMLNQGATLNIVEGVTAEKNQDAGIALGQQTWPEDPNLAPSQPVAGFLSGVNGNIVRSNRLVVNNNGVWLMNGAKDNVVRGNLIGSSSGEAIFLDRATNNLIEGNDIQVAGKHAVLLEGALDNVVRGNSITTAGIGVLVGATTTGTTKGIQSTGNLVEGNVLTDISGPGLQITESGATELIDNVVTLSDSYAIELYLADDNVIRGNEVSGNKGGISLKTSVGNLIEGNNTSDSDSTGIVIASQSLGNIVRANVSNNNIGGGIYIGDETPVGQGTLVEGNTANGNKGMGIQASKPSHIFKDNVAFDNESWGIHAGDPSSGRANVDGGGNIAQGNKGPLGVDLKPQQCYNVRCIGGPGGGDQISPNTSLLETPLDPSTESVAVFRFTGADNASTVTYECRFESTLESAWQACTSPKTYSNLGNDTYTFEVRALDFSGNYDPTPESYTWAVALDGFEASIDSTPDRVTVETSATFAFSANRDSGVTFQCLVRAVDSATAVDWALAPGCSSPATYDGLTPGQYEFWVRATDGASNYDTKMHAWTIGPAAVEAEVSCGQILTQSTKVLNDLVDCGGYGLIVGAPGITIDLDGHIIDGLGLDAGILNNGHDDVTIRSGMISQFLIGVQLNPGTARNVVHTLRLEGNAEAGIALSDADESGDGNTIRDNSMTANQIGIALYSGTRNALIRNNYLAANLGLGAILLEFASGNLIEGNQIGQSGASGIYAIGGGSNTITDNVIKNSGAFGINAGEELLTSNDNLIQRNAISGGAGGIMVAGARNRVVNNDVTATTGPGVLVDMASDTLVKGNDFGGNASGISVAESTGTIVESNNASGTDGSGIAVEELSSNTIVRGNTASGNKGDGVEVTESSVVTDTSVIENNTADANGGEGISIEGAGFTIRGNVAQLNGGWGIYNVGSVDGGGNYAAGNMELDQCFGVVCELGVVPGAPDTWIVSGPADVDTATPGIQTNSRNASFTYMGADEFSPLIELVFECRIDSTNPTAWQDCEYPAEFMNLSPGQHTVDIRAIDMMGQGLADPTPATFTWTYVPLPFGVAPEVILDVTPPAETYLFDAIFTFHANEPDVTFQCKVDLNGWQPCGFEGAAEMHLGAFEWTFVDTEVGPHTFYVRAVDFEGNVGEPTTYTWRLLGITVVITDGPAFVPATGGPLGDPAMGGPSMSTSAEITFEAVPDPGDVTFWCRFDSLDPNGFFPCTSPFQVGPAHAGNTAFPEPLLVGDHMLEVYAVSELMGSMAELEAAEYEWEVVESLDSLPPETTIERAPGAADLSSTVFEFSGVDDLTPPFLLTYECQVTNGTAEPNGAMWEQCFSPFNLLDIYNYGDPEMLLTEHTFWVRAVDAVEPEIVDPTRPDFEGNPDPTPASHTWTPAADSRAPAVVITGGPADGATVGEEPVPYTFAGSDNATPALRLQFECAVYLTAAGAAAADWVACDSPIGGGFDISGLEPGQYTVAVRALDLAGNSGPAATRKVTVAAAPVVTILSGPNGRIDPFSGEASLPYSTTESAVFTFKSDQPGTTFECSLDGAEFVPCNTPSGTQEGVYVHAIWVVDSGTHEVEVRATNAQAIVGLEARYEWVVELGPDATAPNTFVTSGPENGTLNTVATFTFTGSDNRTPAADLRFECALDTTTAWNSCVSPQQFSDLTRGSHTLNVRAIDAASNIDSSAASYTWTVAPPPVVTITSGPAVDPQSEESTDTSATFEFVSDVAGVTFHCWLDGKFNPALATNAAQPAPCSSGVTYENLGYGPHLFAVRAVDGFGNIGVWEDVEFTVLPPQARLTSVPASGESTTATLQFTTDPINPDATFYCSLDGRPFGLCESPKTYNNLFAGEHTFSVQTVYTGVDWTGQPLEFDPVPATHTWTVVDLTAPETIIEFGPPATTHSTSAYFQVNTDEPEATIECTLTSSAGTMPVDCDPGVVTELTDLLPDSYTLSAVATDAFLNVDPTPATHSWTIGTPSGPPNTPVGDNVVVSLALPGGAGDATVTFFSVQTEGHTTLDLLGGGPTLPEGYAGDRIYDISTSALFSEPVIVCLTYDPADYGTTAVRLLHFDGSLWLDITNLNNPFSTPARVCGEAESFSLFAIAAASSGMAPETSILSGPVGPLSANGIPTSTSGSATFEFWADQPGATTQCSIDGLPYVNCESPYTVGPLEPGEHNFLVQSVNEFGWTDLTPALWEWEVLGPDTTPPTTVITKGPAEGSSTANYINTFEFSGSDDYTPVLDLEYQCTLDGVDLGGCETPEQIEVLEAGPHKLVVQAIDAAGNVDPVGVTRNWTVVDMSYPDTSILTGPVEETTETTATFEFEGFEELTDLPVDQFECALDEGDFAACTSPWTLTDLAAGTHVFLVRAVDPEGNRDISPAFYEWLILAAAGDTTPPETFIVHSPPAGNSGPDVIFGFASDEPVEIFECAWGAGAPPAAPATWEECAAVLELFGLPSGQHWLWVRAVDVALNADPTPAPGEQPFVWIVNAEPDTFITSAPSDPTGEFSARFVFESDQPNATFECSIDGLEWTPCTSSEQEPYIGGPFMPDENGAPMEHEFQVRALNEFRNVNNEQVMDLSPATHQWSVQDASAPETEFLGAEVIGPDQIDLEPGLRFRFRGSDDWASAFELMFECGLDNTDDAEPVTWQDCSEPGPNDTFFYEIAYVDLTAGTYTFQVRAIDVAENVDATPVPDPAHTFVIEGEPETTITSSTPDMTTTLETTSTTVTFAFTSDTGATFLCRLDDESGPFVECPGGVAGQATYTDIPYGEHLFEVIAVGAQGTTDLSPAQFSWMSGTDQAPDVTIDTANAPPATGSTATSGSISFSSSDPQATFLCALDASAVLPCTSPFQYTGLLAGEHNPHTFTVEATTPTLLESVVTNEAIHEWVITDEAAPETILLEPLPSNPSGNEVTFTFTGSDNGTIPASLVFQCRLDGAVDELGDPLWLGCSSPHTVSALTGGQHTFEVRATDLVALTDASPTSQTWDVIAPPLTVITNTTPLGEVLEGDTSQSPTGELAFFDQAGSTYECRLDAVDPDIDPFTACTSPYAYDLSNGTHVFEVRASTVAVDGQPMRESPPAQFVWAIDAPDTVDPDTVIQLGPADPTANTSATFIFEGTDNLTAPIDMTYECSLDEAEFASCASGDVYTGLTVGEHTFTVRAIDNAPVPNIDESPALYTWTIEAAGAPNTLTGTNVAVELGDATVTFDQVTADGTTEVRVLTAGAAPDLPSGYFTDGALYYDVSTTATFSGDVTVCLPQTGLADAHVLHYEGGAWVDVSAGLRGDLTCGVVSSLSPFAVVEVSADVAPQTTLAEAADDPTIQSTATGAGVQFQFRSSIDTIERPAEFECKLDGAEWSSCDSPYAFETGFGEHTLVVRAVTNTGVIDVSPESHTWSVLARPVATITSGPADQDLTTTDIESESQTATFEFSAEDPNATFECRITGETVVTTWAPCVTGKTYSDLAFNEEYLVEVQGISADGHASFLPAEFEWAVLDLTAPIVTITSGPAGTVDSKTATFVYDADETVLFECSLDGAVFGSCQSGLEYTGIGLGTHTFDVRATDLSDAENVSQTASRTWTVADLTAPSIAIGVKPPATTSATTAELTFNATDNWPGAVALECSLDAAALAACSSPQSFSGLSAAEHTFEVTATDTAGNTGSATYSWTVEDVNAPLADITNVTTGSLIFEFTGTDDHTTTGDLTFECRVDSDAYAACTSPKTYSDADLAAMTPGDHTFQVRAIDEAGNVGQPDSRDFTVADTKAPDTSVTGQPAATTTNTNASFTFTGSDDGTTPSNLTFECALDGAALGACSSPQAYTSLAVGTHTFEVRATDAAGNVDQSPASHSWTIDAPAPVVDTTAPEASISAQPPATTVETNASFSFAATDDVSAAGSLTFECQLDTAPYAACESPKAYSGLAVGSHSFRVRATDAAGNVDESPASYSWSVQSVTVDCGVQQTLNASADGWIDQGSPTSNKGTDSILKVMSKSGGNLRALLRFELPAMPQGCSVESATLRMFAASARTGRTLEVYQLSGSWSEGAVTWANQPATTGGAVTTSSATGYIEWNVAGLVQAMYGSTNHGFLVRDVSESQDAEQQFNSREKSDNRPQLVITLGTGTPPPPPPGSSDTSPADTTITGSPLAATSSSSADFTFSGTDTVTPAASLTYECQLDSAPYAPCTTPKSYSGLAAGTHTFRVRAIDAHGNVDQSPAAHTWTIDQSAPETVITNGPGTSTTSTTASFQFTSPETGVTFACSLDSAPFAACASPKDYSGLSVGSHTFRVQATDAAGNVDATAASYPWTVQAGGTPANCGTTQTISANADSWIEQGSPSSNKGTDGILKVMSKSGNSNLRALIRFPLPTLPSGCVVDTATLRLYAGSSASGRTLQALRLNGTWTEGGVTWQNQPATTGTPATAASGTGYRQWTVTGIVGAMYSAGTSHGFLIRDASEGQDAEQQFFSREKGESPPQLVLTFKSASAASALGGPGVPASCAAECDAQAGATTTVNVPRLWASDASTVVAVRPLAIVTALLLGTAALAAVTRRRTLPAQALHRRLTIAAA